VESNHEQTMLGVIEPCQ